MTIRIALLALGAMLAGNVFAAGSFSIYFNGESSTANCHVDGVSNAQLSTAGNGNLVATASTPLAFSSACGISGSGQQLTFGPAQPLQGPASTLAAGSNVTGNFSVLPLNAASCSVAFVTTSGAGTVTGPASGYVCGSSGSQSCTSRGPIPFSASFTNTSTNASAYQATVTCQAAAGASPATLTSQATVNQNGNSGGTPTANFTCSQTSSLTIGCTDSSTDSGGTIGSWSWNFGDGGTSTVQSPSHVYASANTYTVSLTVADSVNPSNTSTKTQSVTVNTSVTSCTTGQSGDISGYTALCSGKFTLYTPTAKPLGPNPYSYSFVFGAAWPGAYFGQAIQFVTTTTQFVSVPFVASPGHTMIYSVNGSYTAGGSAAFSISTQPGLFNGGNANGTTVLCVQSGNSASLIASSNGSTANCVLNTAGTYWLNMVNGVFAPNGSFAGGCGKSGCNVAVNLTQNN